MRVKSICLVCRGKQQVIDRITNLPRTCVACDGRGYIEVRSVQGRTVDIQHHNIPARIPDLVPKIESAIKQYQAKFFETKERTDLRPMKLKDIADLVGIHSSTVCMRTRGMKIDGIDVKELFSVLSGVHTDKQVMQMMEEIIAKEPTPYSDNEIQEMLAEKGVSISRRTVTKYRSTLGISTWYERKTENI